MPGTGSGHSFELASSVRTADEISLASDSDTDRVRGPALGASSLFGISNYQGIRLSGLSILSKLSKISYIKLSIGVFVLLYSEHLSFDC